MKIITINTTDSKIYHLSIDEDNHRNNLIKAEYDKEEFKDFEEFMEFVRKEYNLKPTNDYYDWAGVIMIEKEQ